MWCVSAISSPTNEKGHAKISIWKNISVFDGCFLLKTIVNDLRMVYSLGIFMTTSTLF